MKITTIKKMQECFLNKVCTVLTLAVNKGNFNDVQFADFFTGIVDMIDDDGIMIRHHMTGCRSFYPMSHITGILEEQVISEDDPNYSRVVEEIKNAPKDKRPVVATVNPTKQPYVDPAMFAKLAQQAQEFKKT
jgi:hypothetical protein